MTSKQLLEKARDIYPTGAFCLTAELWSALNPGDYARFSLWIEDKNQFLRGESIEQLAALLTVPIPTDAEGVARGEAEIDAASEVTQVTHPAVEEVIQKLQANS